MILVDIKGQTAKVRTTECPVSDSIQYLEAVFNFQGEKWKNAIKTAVFENSEGKAYTLILKNDKITADMHLDLTEGEWRVGCIGSLEDGTRITTDCVNFVVKSSCKVDGEVLPPIPQSLAEQILFKAENAEKIAETAKAEVERALADMPSKSYIENTFASTVKVDMCGNVVSANDVSKVPHIVTVRVNGTDVSSLKLNVTRKNIFGGLAFAEKIKELYNGVIDYEKKTVEFLGRNITEKCLIDLDPQKTYTLFAKVTGTYTNLKYINSNGVGASIIFPTDNTFITYKLTNTKALCGEYQGSRSLYYYENFGIIEGNLSLDEYEKYVATVYPVNNDGTVNNVNSISPFMSMFTEPKKADLTVTYNADTKKYIDNKFNSLNNAILSLGGNA